MWVLFIGLLFIGKSLAIQVFAHNDAKKVFYEHYIKHEIDYKEEDLITTPLDLEKVSQDTSIKLIYQPIKAIKRTKQVSTWKYLLAVIVTLGILYLFKEAALIYKILAGVGALLTSSIAIYMHDIYFQEKILKEFNKEIQLHVGEGFHAPQEIEGYEYIGYLKEYIKEQKEQSTPSHTSGPLTEAVEKVQKEDKAPLTHASITHAPIRMGADEPKKDALKERLKEVVHLIQLVHPQKPIVIDTTTPESKPSEAIQSETLKPSVPELMKPIVNETPKLPKEDVVVKKVITKEIIRPYTELEKVYENTDEMLKGEQKEELGTDGKEVIEYEVIFINDKEVSSKEISHQVISAKPTRVLIGTKVISKVSEELLKNPLPTAVIRTEERREEIPISYQTKTEEDPNLDEGEIDETGGVEGLTVVIYRDTYVENELVKTEQISSTVEKQPKDKIIRKGTRKPLKAKPTIQITSILKDEGGKKVYVDYQLTDTNKAYVSAKAKLYKLGPTNEEIFVRDIDIPTLTTEEKDEKFLIDGLDWEVDYRIKTELTYNNSREELTSIESSTQDFILHFKKIELKYIQSIRLFDSNHHQVISFDSIPNDATSYFVQVKSEKMKDIYIPVKSITEEIRNGKAVYKVVIHTSELTHDTTNDYEDDDYFYIEKVSHAEGVITTFTQLMEAIKKDPSGTYTIGANLSAADFSITPDMKVYYSGVFSGKLIGQNGDDKFGIYGLKLPLFQNLQNATISTIDFKDTNIKVDDLEIGTIAKFAEHTTFSDVSVTGSIEADKDIGGFVFSASKQTKFMNVSFDGKIAAMKKAEGSHQSRELRNFVGAIAGLLNSSAIDKAQVNTNIIAKAHAQYHKIGAVAGFVTSNAQVKNVYASGEVKNIGNTNVNGVQVGGLFGSMYRGGSANNVISAVKVTNGRFIHGDSGFRNPKLTNHFVVDGVASGTDDTLNDKATSISSEEAKQKAEEFGITATATDSDFDMGIRQTDYSQVKDYDPSKANVYHNIERLLPFYHKEWIVKNGNKVQPNTSLGTKTVERTILLQDTRPLHDLKTNRAAGNGLLVYYSDGSTEILDLDYVGPFKDTKIEEYTIRDYGILYTPEMFAYDYEEDLNDLVNELQSKEYMDIVETLYPNYTHLWGNISAKVLSSGGNDVRDTTLRQQALNELKEKRVDPYFMKDSFKQIKDNIKHHLISLLEVESPLDKNGIVYPKEKIDFIKANKDKIMLGLAYVNRWYNVPLGDSNLKDFTLYHQDLFGQDVDHLQLLVNIADIGDSEFNGGKTSNVYERVLGSVNGKATLANYLESFKSILVPNKTMAQWFKESTKAEIVEATTKDPAFKGVDTSVWHNLTRSSSAKNYILPILTMRHKGLGISSTSSSLTFSPFERYHYIEDGENFDNRPEAIQDMRQRLQFITDQNTLFFEMWYRIANPELKLKILNNLNIPMLTWDNHKTKGSGRGSGWMLPFAKDEVTITKNGYRFASPTMQDFFSPIGKWYRNNGLGAYADGTEIFFVVNDALDKYGSSVMTHETTHNLDRDILLGGFGRREGTGAEDYALGMLQSIVNGSTDQQRGINVDTDYALYEGGKHLNTRLHNATPERFQTQEDLKEFYKRSYDLTYLMAYAEAEAYLALDRSDLRYMVNKVVMIPDGNHYKEQFRPYTDEEWNAMNLTTIDDMIDQNMVAARRGESAGRNTYATENMFFANYGLYSTDKGAPGSRSFKQMSFEMMGAAGYEGFLNYTSNRLLNQARQEGETFSDLYIIKKTFNGTHKNFNDLRKAWFAEVYAKKDQLKPFTVNGQIFNSYEEMKTLIKNAVNEDLVIAKVQIGKGERYTAEKIRNVKAEIYRSLINSTDDFRTSIFKGE